MGISALVKAISDNVVGAMKLAGVMPLTDGRILVGRRYVDIANAPPRIVFIPRRSVFAARANTTGINQAARNMWSARSLATDEVHFEAHVIGPALIDGDQGFDLTQWLVHQLIRSSNDIASGAYLLDGGEWLDQRADSSQMLPGSHHFVFDLGYGTPVADDALPFADPAPAPSVTVEIDVGDGTPEAA